MRHDHLLDIVTKRALTCRHVYVSVMYATHVVDSTLPEGDLHARLIATAGWTRIGFCAL